MNYIHEILPSGHDIYLFMERFDKVCVGGTRVRSYPSQKEAFLDCKRLSEAMSYKCAWAELPWYGAKAVINSEYSDLTEKDWAAYAKILNKLEGHFITATDVGVSLKDIAYLKTMTPYVSTTDTAEATASVLIGCIRTVSRITHIPLDTVLIHGMGKIGSLVAKMLYELNASRIFICDIDRSRCDFFKKLDPIVFHVASPDDIDMSVDYLVPCSVGPVFTTENAVDIKALVICGAANSQLENDGMAEYFHDRKILYIPDFIGNSGGILEVAVSEGVAGPGAIECVPKKLEKLIYKSRALRRSLLSIAKEKCQYTLAVKNAAA
jgi:glutamate dehydrogenase/leucine dehydrogenase